MPQQHGPRNRLEQLVKAAHLSLPRFCQAYCDVAGQLGLQLTVSVTQAKRWLAGEQKPQPAARRVLESWWGEPIAELFGRPRSDPPLTRSAEDLVNATARAVGEHAIAAAHSVHASALDQLHAETRRLARAYFTEPPAELLFTVERLRTQVHRLLDSTRKPRQQAELLLMLAELSGLLASITTALGHLDAAESFAGAAYTFAEVIDAPSLCAWARALQVAAAFWAGRPREAVDIAAAALATAPVGTARVRLHAVLARALARLGAHHEVRAAMAHASHELGQAGDDAILDRVGGELGFSPARVDLCGSSAFVLLGDGASAERAAETALVRFSQAPVCERWVAGEVGARIDLGAARALVGDLAGTEDALASVFGLPVERRTDALTQRLHNLGRLLATRPYRKAPEAIRLDEQIAGFTANSLPTTVRALTPADR